MLVKREFSGFRFSASETAEIPSAIHFESALVMRHDSGKVGPSRLMVDG
jgi:hypothetical protein